MPTTPAMALRFSSAQRAAITTAANAISATWSAHFFTDDRRIELASIGPLAGGSDAWDARDVFGIEATPGGGAELLDLTHGADATIHATVSEALEVMAALAAEHLTEDDDWSEAAGVGVAAA